MTSVKVVTDEFSQLLKCSLMSHGWNKLKMRMFSTRCRHWKTVLTVQ